MMRRRALAPYFCCVPAAFDDAYDYVDAQAMHYAVAAAQDAPRGPLYEPCAQCR